MRTLVLGGTAWVGAVVAETAVGLGHDVTCLARGSAPFPAGVRAVRHDRREPWPAELGPFDLVVDVARDPDLVAGGLDAARYVLVSTGNVYARHDVLGDDETAPLLTSGEEPPDDYGYAKVRCEQRVAGAYSDHLLARSGLIGGPGDRTGRTTYWPWRLARSARAVVPARLDAPVQLLDVRDLARWLLTTDATGPVDAVGPVTTLAEHLAAAGAAELVPADPAWLQERGVAEWGGPRSLPLWLADPGWRGFAARSGARARAAGLVARPLAETLADGLAALDGDEPATGLSDADHEALLAELG